MEVTLKPGSILMKEGTLLPPAMEALSDSVWHGWRTFSSLNGYALSRKIEAERWHFFCLAGAVRASAIGRDRQNTLQRAVKRILAKSAGEKYNSLEVTEVTPKRFLGVPYVRVSALLRHVQEDVLLAASKDPPGKSAAHRNLPPKPALVLLSAEK